MPAHVQLTIISRATLSFAAPGIVEASGRYALAILAAFGPASLTQLFEQARQSGIGGPEARSRHTAIYWVAMRIILLFLVAVSCAIAASQYTGELIFPQEKWHNHSSSIVELPNGDLLVCWFHGSGERTADDVLINGARWSHTTRKWSAPFVMADTPGFPETNPVLFIDSRQRLFFLWPLIIAHRWESALMKYRISTDYQQPDGPPKWQFQDNIVLVPKNLAALTREWAGD